MARSLQAQYWHDIQAAMTSQTLHFFKGGKAVTAQNVPPTRTLLEVLREDLACTGTKEGCAQGDCGACTVVIGEPTTNEAGQAQLKYSAINSCIRLAHSVRGLAVWTVEDIAPMPGQSHPAQQAMIDCHGSQCGFCTPGFVMSLFAMYQNHVLRGQTIDHATAQEELSGNLCRCTGYRPILDAAQQMARYPAARLDEPRLIALMAQQAAAGPATGYLLPDDLSTALQARMQHPSAQIVAGCTDVGLWVTKQHRQFSELLDLTRVAQLRQIQHHPHHTAIGAAVTLTDAYAALASQRPQLKAFANRFAGPPVRNSGTLGGNIANGSPIGDSMPLLIALNASLTLTRWDRATNAPVHRDLPLEDFYIGYRKNVLLADEILAWIRVPTPPAGEFMRVYKLSKRFDDDISAVCLAINIRLAQGRVMHASIGAGGVAATPARAVQAEQTLLSQLWTQDTVKNAALVLQQEFAPISDMRASDKYRRAMLGALLLRFWHESQGTELICLDSNKSALEAS
jgi:xanthine dehydrogenase small subunit